MKYGLKIAGKVHRRRFLTKREAEREAEIVMGLKPGQYEVLGTQPEPTTLQHKMVSYWEKGKLPDGDPASFITRSVVERRA